MPDRTAGLRAAAEHAEAFLATLDERPVAARADAAAVRSCPRRAAARTSARTPPR